MVNYFKFLLEFNLRGKKPDSLEKNNMFFLSHNRNYAAHLVPLVLLGVRKRRFTVILNCSYSIRFMLCVFFLLSIFLTFLFLVEEISVNASYLVRYFQFS